MNLKRIDFIAVGSLATGFFAKLCGIYLWLAANKAVADTLFAWLSVVAVTISIITYGLKLVTSRGKKLPDPEIE